VSPAAVTQLHSRTEPLCSGECAQAAKEPEAPKALPPAATTAAPTPATTNGSARPLTGSAALLVKMKQKAAPPPPAAATNGAPLTGSAALLAKMRAAKAAPPAAAAAAAADSSAPGAVVPLWILYGGEAAAQVAADLSAEAAAAGMPNTLLTMEKFQVRCPESAGSSLWYRTPPSQDPSSLQSFPRASKVPLEKGLGDPYCRFSFGRR
jgi:hypothetical protein